MRLILKENSLKFNDKHSLQTLAIAMGTKKADGKPSFFAAQIFHAAQRR